MYKVASRNQQHAHQVMTPLPTGGSVDIIRDEVSSYQDLSHISFDQCLEEISSITNTLPTTQTILQMTIQGLLKIDGGQNGVEEVRSLANLQIQRLRDLNNHAQKLMRKAQARIRSLEADIANPQVRANRVAIRNIARSPGIRQTKL